MNKRCPNDKHDHCMGLNDNDAVHYYPKQKTISICSETSYSLLNLCPVCALRLSKKLIETYMEYLKNECITAHISHEGPR
jgi:hypothetical protein